MDGGEDGDGEFRQASPIGDGLELGLVLGLGRRRELTQASFLDKDFVGGMDSFREEPLRMSNGVRRGNSSFGF